MRSPVIAKKPFMVYDLTGVQTGGAPAYTQLMAANKIVVGSASVQSSDAAKRSPYLWNYGADPEADVPVTAAFVGRSLAGEKAKWSGDTADRSKTRAFGVVYPNTGFDLATFERLLKENGGGKIAAGVEFDAADETRYGEQMPTFAGKLKQAGVTSVILFGSNQVIAPLMAAATSQDYHPEWIFTGTNYHDFDLFARAYDPDQMRQAFGISTIYPGNQPDGSKPPSYLDRSAGTGARPRARPDPTPTPCGPGRTRRSSTPDRTSPRRTSRRVGSACPPSAEHPTARSRSRADTARRPACPPTSTHRSAATRH